MKQSDKYSDIREIADAVCSKSATPEQLQQLETLLSGNFEAKQFYYEYISMHCHLESRVERNMEFVYRRMTEEFVVRPQSENSADHSVSQPPFLQPPSESNKKTLLIVIAVIVLLVLLLIWQSINRTATAFSAQITQGHVSIVGKGAVEANTLYGGEYQIEQDTELTLTNGDIFYLSADSRIKLFSDTEIQLKAGSLVIEPLSGNNITVNGTNYSLHSNGTELSLDLTHKQPLVFSGENTVLFANRWRPKHFWSFDGNSDQVINSAGSAYGIPDKGATRTKGLLGEGAFYFDNSAKAIIDVGTGGGTAPATGSFSALDGMTLEVLIKPEYSGKRLEIDEIFRKGHHGEELRFMLSFHHEHWKDYLRPQIDVHESLSFGLYLVGQGYHELKLPLDGHKGRPTLAQMKDGSAYHVVASYNVNTGLKAIYINGKQLASYQYPPGSKMLSGGPSKAVIGSNPLERLAKKYAFSGTIDELAFYDFALPPFIVTHHYQQIQQGRNYFGLTPSSAQLPQQIKIPLPASKTLILNVLTGLPEKILNN